MNIYGDVFLNEKENDINSAKNFYIKGMAHAMKYELQPNKQSKSWCKSWCDTMLHAYDNINTLKGANINKFEDFCSDPSNFKTRVINLYKKDTGKSDSEIPEDINKEIFTDPDKFITFIKKYSATSDSKKWINTYDINSSTAKTK